MTVAYSKALATIESSEDDSSFGPHGGFRAILSTPSRDRDGDELAQADWLELPDRLPLDVDHGMSVATTIGSFHPYWDGEKMMMEAAFSSIDRAQEVRTLVNEKHIGSVSVAFMTDKTKKSGEPRRELLNCGVVCIPSNRDAKILDSKALDVRAEELGAERLSSGDDIDDKSPNDDVENKDAKKPYGDVEYADPGYRDGVHRYPINSPEHVRAAWSYIHHSHDRSFYTPEQLSHIEARIKSAAHKFGIELSDDSKSLIPQKNVEGFDELIQKFWNQFVSPELGAEEWFKEYVDQLDDVCKTLLGVDIGLKAAADQPLAQAVHDASVHLGAVCYPLVPDIDPTGASEGANDPSGQKAIKSADFRALVAGVDAAIDEAYRLASTVDREGLPEAAGQALDLLTAAHESVGNLMKELGIFDPDADEDYNKSALGAFMERLAEIFEKSGHESPAESPVDDASTKEPSDAADDAAEAAIHAEAMSMWLALSN